MEALSSDIAPISVKIWLRLHDSLSENCPLVLSCLWLRARAEDLGGRHSAAPRRLADSGAGRPPYHDRMDGAFYAGAYVSVRWPEGCLTPP